MAVSAMLRTTKVEVTPGAAARCHVLIRNNSAVVDQFVFTVRGDVGPWTKVKPERVNLMPQQEVAVELTFAPERTFEVVAGEHPFALQVSSREDPLGSVVQEGVVDVEPFTDVGAVMVPVTSSARRVGKHTVAIDNLGNHRHTVEVTAEDPDAKLTFKCRPHAPTLEPGTTTFVKVRARPRKYFWKGRDRTLPFVVKILVPTAEPVDVEGKLEQKPLIPQRFFWLLTALFALLVILVMIVTLLLRQRAHSVAGPSPSVELTPTTTTTAKTAKPTTTTSKPKSTSRSAPPRSRVVGAGGAATQQPGSVTYQNFTVTTQAYPGSEPQEFSYVVPTGPRYRVLSVVLRNPARDTGTVRIQYENTVLGTVNLTSVANAENHELTFRPANPPLVSPGQRVTLAVTCTNAKAACTPSGVFTAALVS